MCCKRTGGRAGPFDVRRKRRARYTRARAYRIYTVFVEVIYWLLTACRSDLSEISRGTTTEDCTDPGPACGRVGGGASKDQRHALRGRYKTRGKKKRKKITNDRSIRTQQHVNRITIVLGRFDAKRGEVTTAESTCTERESLDTTLLPATTNTARIVKLPIFSEKFSPRESETPRARWRVLSRKRRENVFSAALPPAPRHVWHTTLATRPPVRRVMFRTNGRRRRTTF